MPQRRSLNVLFALTAITAVFGQQQPTGDGCGVDKSCFFQPNDCWRTGNGTFSATGCVLGATFTDVGGGKASVQIVSFVGDLDGANVSTNGIFAAFGLSNDKWMGDDTVMACAWSPYRDPPRFIFTYNVGHSHSADYTSHASNVSTKASDGLFWCQFTTDVVATGGNAAQLYPLNQPYYFFLARGVANPQSQSMIVHGLSDSINFPFVSYDKYVAIPTKNGKYCDAEGDHGWASTVSRTMQYRLVYAHGGLMMFGFWVLLGTGIILGRYYKVFFPANPKLGSTAAWFQLHRGLNSLGAMCVVVSFICIFVSTGHLLDDKNLGQTYIHMILGITAVILIILLPVTAIFRPAPSTPYRPLFRDFHFFFAMSAFALSFGCFVLAASDVSKSGMTDDPTCTNLMYCVVAIFGFLNIFQTLYMRLYQARRTIVDVNSPIREKIVAFEKPHVCAPATWPLHFMTFLYVASTFAIAVYLTKTCADEGVKTLGEKFPN